jgi:hypothetical protein
VSPPWQYPYLAELGLTWCRCVSGLVETYPPTRIVHAAPLPCTFFAVLLDCLDCLD